MKCAREGCEEQESRINGYCSCHCEEIGEWTEEYNLVCDQKNTLKAKIARYEKALREIADARGLDRIDCSMIAEKALYNPPEDK